MREACSMQREALSGENITSFLFPSGLYLILAMDDKSLSQITFEFFGAQEEGKEMLSRQPAPEQKPQPTPKPTRGRKSLKEVFSEAEQIEIPEDEILFQKQYYPIGEVALMFKVNTSLIRYWENEFDILEPRKNRKGDRFFKPSDVKNLQLIHDLLRRRKFTIEGAKDYIKKNRQAREKYDMIQSLQKMRAFLLELKANL
jgi:DNA-binding transcriptional MerR regulator